VELIIDTGSLFTHHIILIMYPLEIHCAYAIIILGKEIFKSIKAKALVVTATRAF
jgi:hypothetical protein